jgi:hypothetical protein
MNKIFMIPIIVLMLISFCYAGTLISNSVVEEKFLSDYQKISGDSNRLQLSSKDFVDTSKNQVLVKQVDTSQGVTIIQFDVNGKTIKKITGKPEAIVVVENNVKCFHCNNGVVEIYPATKSDCMANNDLLFPDEAEKACQSEPEATCYSCNTESWTIDKAWMKPSDCSGNNQYLEYDAAREHCQKPEQDILVDCFFCAGGYKLITSKECSDNGGHLLKEECENPLCYTCDNILGKSMPFEECEHMSGFIEQKKAVEFCKFIDCWTCVEKVVIYNPVIDDKQCNIIKGYLSFDEARERCSG